MKKQTLSIILAIATGLVLTGCVSDARHMELEERVNYLENKLEVGSEKVQTSNGVESRTDFKDITSNDNEIIGEARVMTPSMNVRSKPDITSDRVGALVSGQVVEVISVLENGEWICVIYNGQKAYLMAKYVEITFY